MGAVKLFFGVGQGLDHLAGDAQHQAAGRDHRSLGDQRARPHDRAGTDDGVVQHGGLHADEAGIVDAAGVEHRAVTDDYVRADDAGAVVGDMEDRSVLDVGPGADAHGSQIAAQDAAVPDRDVVGEPHAADDGGAGGDEDAFASRRQQRQVAVDDGARKPASQLLDPGVESV